ncbi:Cytochrome P450 52A13 [Penicillium brasilianum]|uniref:Cytochrome P450 52A13 n=1 Tax=Penicillium brasilianum TaxID=104259 RepID=A0A1S9RLJ9_PENBI|nr:Cytochrome P450 52A13 [Penicillium brasilianum]
MLRPLFAKTQMVDLGLEEKHTQNLFQRIPANKDGWTNEINITKMLFQFTLDFTTESLFETTVHSQLSSSPQKFGAKPDGSFTLQDLAKNFDDATHHVQRRFRLLDFHWLHNPKSFRENIKYIHRFIDLCIQSGMEGARHKEQPELDTEKKTCFLNGLLNKTRDAAELRDQSLNILIASRDTTASLMSWTFWLLAKHPPIYDKLRSHVIEKFGTYDSDQANRITFEALKSCKYLQFVMKEVLRLYPPIAINSRKAIKDTSLPLGGGPDEKSPIFVKAGQDVLFYAHITHTLKEFWGPDANKFDPDRWAEYKSSWAYLPFSGGPRICLGQQFALAEAGYLITRMLQKFDQAKLVDPQAPATHRPSTTDSPADYMIYFHEARPV